MNVGNSVWTDEMVEALRVAWCVKGQSSAEIAKDLNRRFRTKLSRNSIIGKARRVGFVQNYRLPPSLLSSPGPFERRLRALWLEPISLDKIAQELGAEFGGEFTAGAVRLKGLRMGLPARPPYWAVGPKAPSKPRAVAESARAKPAPGPHIPPPILTVVPVQPAPEPASAGPSLSILELVSTSCRFPISGDGAETRFCGSPRGDGPYCARHSRIAFVARPKKQIKPPYEATVVTTARVREPKRASA